MEELEELARGTLLNEGFMQLLRGVLSLKLLIERVSFHYNIEDVGIQSEWQNSGN